MCVPGLMDRTYGYTTYTQLYQLITKFVIYMKFFIYLFIYFRNPNGKNENQIWKPVTSPNVEYLYINETVLEMREKPCWDEYEFWKSLGSPPLLKPDMSIELFRDSNYLD